MFGIPRDISDENWSIRFIILCWLIWKRRYSFVLASEVRQMEDILTSGDKLVEECRRAFYAQAAPSVAPTLATSWSSPDDVINLVEDDKVLSNLVRLPLGHVGVPFDPGGN
ncbi:hypothetical protein V6N13_094657 [Hibiscus sabdariffa]